MLFVKPQVRQGLLGRMLTELLNTRVMVKQAMKAARGNKVRLLTNEVSRLTDSGRHYFGFSRRASSG